MALENITNAINPLKNDAVWSNLPPEILAPFAKLITILKIAGVVVLVYILFLLTKGILSWKRNKKINLIYEKIIEIDNKLERLLNKTKEVKSITKKQEKKPGFFIRLFRKKEFKKEKKK